VPPRQSKSHAQQARTAQQARLQPNSVLLELTVQPTPLLQQSVLMVQRTVNLDSRMLLHVLHAVLGAMLMQLGLQVAPCAQQALSALLVHSCSLLAIWVSTVLKAQPVLHSVQLLITARTLIPRPSANLDRTALLEAPPVLPAPQDITVLPQTRRPNASQACTALLEAPHITIALLGTTAPRQAPRQCAHQARTALLEAPHRRTVLPAPIAPHLPHR
jgi:hypothetical protein